MTKFLGLLCLLTVAGSIGHADTAVWTDRKADFTYFNAYSYVSCDYAESSAKAVLTQLGARNISVTCAGGLPDPTPITVWAKFQAAMPATTGETATWQMVTLKGDEACDFNDTVIRSLLPSFSTQSVNATNSCWNSQGSYTYGVQVLK